MRINNNKIDLHIVTYYMSDDPEFKGDYTKMEIYSGEELLKTYGDAYHDHGGEKVDGFLDGLQAVGYTIFLTRENRIDEDL